jgi:CcmD family protein
MQNLNYLFGAYSVIWIIICLYLLHIGQKQHKMIREVEKNKKID